MDLGSYREKAREFLAELFREQYQHHAGLKDELAVAPIYRKFEALFTDDAVKELAEKQRTAAPDDEKPLRYLLNFAASHALNAEVFGEDQQLAKIQSAANLTVAGERVSFHDVLIRLANDRDPGRREALFQARLSVVRQENPLRIQRMEKIHAKAQRLFGTPYLDLYQQLTRVNFPVLKTQLENFLVASESYYSSHLERYATRLLGGGIGKLNPWDVSYLFRGHLYDHLFPEDRMLSLLKRTLMGLGFDLKKLRNVVIDSTARPSKSSLAHCFPVRVPDEVYLVLRPQGGVYDFLTLFHEAAHALQFALTSEKENFEYRFIGDPAVSKTYGFLFEYLTLNEDWVQDFLRARAPDTDFLEYTQFRKLYLLRRYAARFLFELTLHSRTNIADPDLPDVYSTTLEKALHLPFAPATYLADVEDAFFGVRFLRAWIFEAELRQILLTRFGARWYSRPAAGDFLRDMWSNGLRYDCDELAARIRSWGLNLDPITREVQK